MKKIFLILLCFIASSILTYSQDDKNAQKEAQKKERAALEQVFRAYQVCRFDNGLQIPEIDRITKNKIQYLARPTAKAITDKSITAGKSEDRMILRSDGVLFEGVSRTDGYRIMFAFNPPDYFANLRVDRSLPEGYAEDKEILLRWIDFLNRERVNSETKSVQEVIYNGFKVYSINRNTIDYDEPGITIFFDDANEIYVTIYLLYQRPKFRNYKTLEEWKALRDKFLQTYTGCVRENLKNIQTK